MKWRDAEKRTLKPTWKICAFTSYSHRYACMARPQPICPSSFPRLIMEFKGAEFNNNGQISLSVRQAAERMGVARDTLLKPFMIYRQRAL